MSSSDWDLAFTWHSTEIHLNLTWPHFTWNSLKLHLTLTWSSPGVHLKFTWPSDHHLTSPWPLPNLNSSLQLKKSCVVVGGWVDQAITDPFSGPSFVFCLLALSLTIKHPQNMLRICFPTSISHSEFPFILFNFHIFQVWVVCVCTGIWTLMCWCSSIPIISYITIIKIPREQDAWQYFSRNSHFDKINWTTPKKLIANCAEKTIFISLSKIWYEWHLTYNLSFWFRNSVN